MHGSWSPHSLLTAAETATLLRTTRRAVYAMVERDQLPGVIRIGRRLLFRRDDLLAWLGLAAERAAEPPETPTCAPVNSTGCVAPAERVSDRPQPQEATMGTPKTKPVADEIAKIEKLTVRQLQVRVRRLTGVATRSTNRAAMIQRCRKAIETGDSKPAPAKKRKKPQRVRLDVGTTLTRVHKGKEITVTVTDAGFEWDGSTYPSLSAAAVAIVGYPISGPAFFKLERQGGEGEGS